MKEQNVNSFDLIQAQQLLNQLVGKPGGSVQKQLDQVEIPNYSKLLAITPPKTAEPVVADDEDKKGVVSKEAELAFEDFNSWEACIAWCMNATKAEASFVVDSQGFVIASRGRIPSQGFEGAGAELICSIEQLERIAPDAGTIRCIDVDFDRRRMVGFVASTENTPQYVVGLVAPEPLLFDVKLKISRHMVANLPNMD
jgi:hypothetical protein